MIDDLIMVSISIKPQHPEFGIVPQLTLNQNSGKSAFKKKLPPLWEIRREPRASHAHP
jgi:hypothetical protein